MPSGRLPPGTYLGDSKYRIEACLGAGGMGEVYRANNVAIDRVVAIKLLHTEHAKDPQVRSRFLQEARAANRVRHPNVVDVLDIDEDETYGPFIVQEYLEGQDLDFVLDELRGALSFDAAMRITIPVVEAIGMAHSQGVVHRDLKPANVFLHEQAGHTVPKVLDFGIARIVGRDPLSHRITSAGSAMGTPAYMAPEVVQSGARAAEAPSDVWSLGVMLYEILSGELPFEAETMNALFITICTQPPAPLESRAKTLPPEIYAIVDRCLAKAPQDRYASANELAQELRRVWAANAEPAATQQLVEGALQQAIKTATLRASRRPPPAVPRVRGVGTTGSRLDASKVAARDLQGLAVPPVPREASGAIAVAAPAQGATSTQPQRAEQEVELELDLAPTASVAARAAGPAIAGWAPSSEPVPVHDGGQNVYPSIDPSLDGGAGALELDLGTGPAAAATAPAAARRSRASGGQDVAPRPAARRARSLPADEHPSPSAAHAILRQVGPMFTGLVATGVGAQLAGARSATETGSTTALAAVAVVVLVASLVVATSTKQRIGALAAGASLFACASLFGLRALAVAGVAGAPDLDGQVARWAVALAGTVVAVVAALRAKEIYDEGESILVPVSYAVVTVAGAALLAQSVLLALR